MSPSERINAAVSRESYADETALVMAAKAGQEEAFTELIIRHRERILSVAGRITNNQADAEDVYQTTCLQVFLHIRGFDCRSNFSAWVTRIAINSALMLLRRHWAANTTSMDEVIEFDPSRLRDPKADIWAEVLSQERAWHLERAVGKLHPRLRTVMQLQMRQQGSITQTAKLTGLSVPAAKSRLFRARRELRRHLQASLYPVPDTAATDIRIER